MGERARIWIDGRELEVDPSHNMLEVALEHGFDLPYFCWHPAMGSVGACRQCAVKQFEDEDDDRGKIVMACMTPAGEDTRISIRDREAVRFRAGIIEWLMANHPHDCPVCDEGGECHLQDMTVMTGHVYRRHRFPKRTYRNQDLGPFIHHEMNRCIQCYRCVRFYDDLAGGDDLQAFAAHDHVWFGRSEDGPLESPFAGNLVEVCPTGVFTDRTFRRHYTRKWDLTTAPSVCVHCGLGCATTPGERYGTIRRIRARYHGRVNGHFLCDRGRFGYEFVNHERRLRDPLVPRGPDRPAERERADEALERIAAALRSGHRAIGLGSPRASLESNFALREMVGREWFHAGLSRRDARLTRTALAVLRRGGCRTPSLREIERCDAVLVLGEDVAETAPLVALALRQAVRQAPLAVADDLDIPRWHDAAVREAVQGRRGPLFVATVAPTAIDDISRRPFRAAPAEIARLGRAVAEELDDRSASVADLAEETRALAREIAEALGNAKRPLVISGTGLADESIVRAAAAVARAVGGESREPAELFLAVPECNSLGLAMLGGGDLDDAEAALAAGDAEVLVVLENDLLRRIPRERAERLLSGARSVVVVDHLAHDTAARADLVLPAATFAEAGGTLVNNEGRAQRFYRVMPPDDGVRAGWRWIREIARRAGGALRDRFEGWRRLDDVLEDLSRAEPALAGARTAAPPADARVAGSRPPRQLHRYSGRTAMHADRDVVEPTPPDDPDGPLGPDMEGIPPRRTAALVAEFRAPGWNSVQALHRFQEEIEGPLRGGDPGERLIEPATGPADLEYGPVPPPFEARKEVLRAVPVYHVFGSEETSRLAPGIAQRTSRARVSVHPGHAAAIGAEDGDAVDVEVDGILCRAELTTCEELPFGIVTVPVGIDPFPASPWTGDVRIRKR